MIYPWRVFAVVERDDKRQILCAFEQSFESVEGGEVRVDNLDCDEWIFVFEIHFPRTAEEVGNEKSAVDESHSPFLCPLVVTRSRELLETGVV